MKIKKSNIQVFIEERLIAFTGDEKDRTNYEYATAPNPTHFHYPEPNKVSTTDGRGKSNGLHCLGQHMVFKKDCGLEIGDTVLLLDDEETPKTRKTLEFAHRYVVKPFDDISVLFEFEGVVSAPMKSRKVKTGSLREFIDMTPMSGRLLAILSGKYCEVNEGKEKAQDWTLPFENVEDITKESFMQLRNAGHLSWDEFVELTN